MKGTAYPLILLNMPEFPFTSSEIVTATGILFAVFSIAVLLSVRNKYPYPYERVPSILTPPEQQFYKVLQSVLKGRVLIMPKVRIADILKVKSSISRKDFWRHFTKISQKHIDFVLLDPQRFTTLCLIELDDKSHEQFNRRKRDEFVNRIMAEAGIPLYRFSVRRHYDRAEILQTLNACLRR